jgi:hypothetical protein
MDEAMDRADVTIDNTDSLDAFRDRIERLLLGDDATEGAGDGQTPAVEGER